MLNMGVEPFLITAALNVIVAQRLARRICPECRGKVDIPKQALLDLQVAADKVGTFECFKGAGCGNCSNTGYKGRIAIYEVLVAHEPLKELILNGASAAEIKAESIRLGMKTLRQGVITKLIEGTTTVDEVSRVSAAD
jgi:type IV pilus assembly protein PilB